ncbi:hypothetical protein CW733_00700 [Lacinutrix sp. Bg11-31]|nr:hypothetical protein CW733_00700 [Lacinutrix sp. Bg11-31]
MKHFTIMLISKISIIISIIGIWIAVKIQYDLFVGYQTANAKTQALYGLTHLMQIHYVFIGITSFIFSIISIFIKENLKTIILTLSLSILSILLLVLEIWRLFL